MVVESVWADGLLDGPHDHQTVRCIVVPNRIDTVGEGRATGRPGLGRMTVGDGCYVEIDWVDQPSPINFAGAIGSRCPGEATGCH